MGTAVRFSRYLLRRSRGHRVPNLHGSETHYYHSHSKALRWLAGVVKQDPASLSENHITSDLLHLRFTSHSWGRSPASAAHARLQPPPSPAPLSSANTKPRPPVCSQHKAPPLFLESTQSPAPISAANAEPHQTTPPTHHSHISTFLTSRSRYFSSWGLNGLIQICEDIMGYQVKRFDPDK